VDLVGSYADVEGLGAQVHVFRELQFRLDVEAPLAMRKLPWRAM